MTSADLNFDNVAQWSHQQWGQATLGDARRTQRAVRLGAALAAQPSVSLPAQTQSWAALKAAYRLLNEPAVTHAALRAPHWAQTRAQAAASAEPVVLFVQDTTNLDFSQHPRTQGLGQIGDSRGRGLLVHTCLAVEPAASGVEPAGRDETAAKLLGVAAQQVWARVPKLPPAGTGRPETRLARQARPNEAQVWAALVTAIGPVPATAGTWVSVGDRGSDIFAYVRQARALGWHCLLRVCQDRTIQLAPDYPAGHPTTLLPWARTLGAQTTKALVLRGRAGWPARTVNLPVAWAPVALCAPGKGSERGAAPLPGWCIRCWEVAPAAGQEAVEWLLFSTGAVPTAHEALRQLEWYSCRWLIEEYHKCLKSGCAMAQRQLASRQGLCALLGFLAIVAVRLLQLRTLSRTHPQAAAQAVIEPRLVAVLGAQLQLRSAAVAQLTVRQFWHGVARLGGFIGRRSDGEPGWQTLWRGWQRLQDMAWGAGCLNNAF